MTNRGKGLTMTASQSGSNSVQATDGSTIAWTRTGNTVTAVGSQGRQMTIEQMPADPGYTGALVTFSGPGGQYLKIDRSASASTACIVLWSPEAESALTLDSVVGPVAKATLTAQVGSTSLRWNGEVRLADNPVALLDKTGYKQALTPVLKDAAYFAPACKLLVQEAIGTQVESFGQFVGKAVAWGLGAVAGALLTAETGGLDLLVLGGVFLTGADASMISDDIELLGQETDSGGCFGSGTVVAMPGGRRRAIEDIKVGDVVLSRDEITRVNGTRRVQHTWAHPEKCTVDIRLENGETIRATTVHQVFTVDRGLIGVDNLTVGDRLETSSGHLAVEEITPVPSPVTVHNLTIEGYHTYFVGEAGVWVHNDKVCINPSKTDGPLESVDGAN
jgi:Pretoxin HINT domain